MNVLIPAALGAGLLWAMSRKKPEAFYLQGNEIYQLTIKFEPSLSGIDHTEVARILGSQLSGHVGRMEPLSQTANQAVMTVWMYAVRSTTILKAPIHFRVGAVAITASVLDVKVDPIPPSMT